MEIIYCADGNRRFAEIAIAAGFLYGAQLPNTIYHAPHFVDQNWKNPDRESYMAALREHKPYMATVLDWEQSEQLSEVLGWAEDAAQYVDVVVIIPKVAEIYRLPRIIGGKSVRLGYSVPTRFGGTTVPIFDFIGWPVHLLGGAPHEQMAIAGGYSRRRGGRRQCNLFRAELDVVSVDGNMHQKMATQFCAFWAADRTTPRGYWPNIIEYDGQPWGDGSDSADAPYEAFFRSCRNIMAAWQRCEIRR